MHSPRGAQRCGSPSRPVRRCPRRQDFAAHSWPERRLDDWLDHISGNTVYVGGGFLRFRSRGLPSPYDGVVDRDKILWPMVAQTSTRRLAQPCGAEVPLAVRTPAKRLDQRRCSTDVVAPNSACHAGGRGFESRRSRIYLQGFRASYLRFRIPRISRARLRGAEVVRVPHAVRLRRREDQPQRVGPSREKLLTQRS
jgi:hypothetical protein